jgi:glucodextranase-like protein
MRKLGTIIGITAAFGAAALTGCADQPYDPSAPAVDPRAPVVHITSPRRGTFLGTANQLAVFGTASDASGLAGVQVNGVDAAVAADGTWSATIPVSPGTQLIHAVARDRQGNLGKESRAVVAGPMQPIATSVSRAIAVTMSAQTFDALGRGITGVLGHGDVESLIAAHNPVIDVGGGPDCNFVQASITRIAFGPASQVNLVPQPGGLAADVELDHVSLGMTLSYSVLCLDGGRDITVAASHVKVTGILGLGVKASGFDLALTHQSVSVTGFDVDLGGLPGDVVNWLHLDTALGPVLGAATEHFVVPLLNGALDGLNNTRTIDVLGTPVDVQLTPANIAIDARGAVIEVNSELRAHGDAGSPGFVYVANQRPAMSPDHGFALAVADDAANQLLASFWAARGLDRTFDLATGSYGDIGELYDRVELSAAVPPFIDAEGGALKLTIGDLLATFKNGSAVTTQIAVSAEVDLQITADATGKPRLDIGTPTTYVDVLDDDVSGANVLSNAQFEAIASFALARVIAVGSGAVGAVPLPAFGGVGVHDLAIAEHTGYLVVDGAVE